HATGLPVRAAQGPAHRRRPVRAGPGLAVLPISPGPRGPDPRPRRSRTPLPDDREVARGALLPRPARQPPLLVVLLPDPAGHAQLADRHGPGCPLLLRAVRRGQRDLPGGHGGGLRRHRASRAWRRAVAAQAQAHGGILPPVLSRDTLARLP